jgi:hypothetical protein
LQDVFDLNQVYLNKRGAGEVLLCRSPTGKQVTLDEAALTYVLNAVNKIET